MGERVTDTQQSIRAHMRDMGSRAGVPIEPPEQTALINACVAQAGVIAGGVPGGAPLPLHHAHHHD